MCFATPAFFVVRSHRRRVSNMKASPTEKPGPSMAQQVADAASASQRQRTGRAPKTVNVVLNRDTLVITLRGVLSPAEKAMAASPGGAAKVQEFHRQLFSNSAEPLRQEIRRITGVNVREASAEIEPRAGIVQVLATGTMVQVFLLAEGIPDAAWAGNDPIEAPKTDPGATTSRRPEHRRQPGPRGRRGGKQSKSERRLP